MQQKLNKIKNNLDFIRVYIYIYINGYSVYEVFQ